MKKIIFLTIILFFLILNLFCNEKNNILKLTIDEAVSLSLQKNLDIKIENLSFDEKKWALATSWNKVIPSVKMSTRLSTVNKNVLDNAFDEIKDTYKENGIHLSDSDVYDTDEWENVKKGSVSAELGLYIDLNAKIIFEIRKTVLDWQVGKISIEIAKKKLEKEIKKNYYNLKLLKENILIKEKSLQTAKNRYDIAKLKYKNGIINEIENLNAEYSYEKIKPQLIEIKNSYENAMLEFKLMLGIKENIEVELISNMDNMNKYEFDEKSISLKYLNNNLEVKKIEGEIRLEKNNRNIYISELTPTLSFSFSTDATYQKSDPFGKDNHWFYNINDDWKEEFGNFTFTVSIPLSSFAPFSKEQMNIVISSYEIEKKKLFLEQTRLNKELEIKKIIRKINKNNELLESLKLNVTITEKVYNLAERSFKEGAKTLLEVEDAENNMNNAKLELLQAKYDYLSAIYDIEYIIDTKINELIKSMNN